MHRRFPGFYKGKGLKPQVATELLTLAYELNRSELFLFTLSRKNRLRHGAGFWYCAGGELAVLMETAVANGALLSPAGFIVNREKQIGATIVANANPFYIEYHLSGGANACPATCM